MYVCEYFVSAFVDQLVTFLLEFPIIYLCIIYYDNLQCDACSK
jgi:hypothetical protein